MRAVSFLLLLLSASASPDFSLKGDPCSKSDLCGSKSAPKTCSCGPDCRLFGTCCQDVADRGTSGPDFRCFDRLLPNPVFAKRACADDFRGHVGDRLACFDDDEDAADVANTLPVTSRMTKIVYWNRHCARCSHEEESALESWNINVLCPRRPGIDASLIRRNLTYDPEREVWGVETGGVLHPCSVQYSPPSFVDQVTHCTPNLVSSCPGNYTDGDVAAKCSQYYAERRDRGSGLVYRNVHCAICGAASVRDLECPGMSPDREEGRGEDRVEVTFYGGDWLEKEPGKEFECSGGYAYDPARKKCRRNEIKEYPAPVSRSRALASTSAVVAVALIFAL